MSTTAIVYENKVGDFAENRWLNDKANTGICFSGGGSRAQIVAMGQMRALEHLGVMDNVKYISSVSGGTWASVEYAYRKEDDTKELIGTYVKPKELTKEFLSKNTPKIAKSSVRMKIPFINIGTMSPFTFNYLLNLANVNNGNINANQQWESVVADTFLKPFGLLDDFQKDLFAFNEDSLNEFSNLNSSFDPKSQTVKLQNKNSPYLIINGVITKPLDSKNLQPSSDFISSEFTPLYSEIPFRANNGKSPNYGPLSNPIYIGNGAINSICFGSTPIGKLNNNTIEVTQHEQVFGLGTIAGISSHFLGGVLSNISILGLFIPILEEIISFIQKNDGVMLDTIMNNIKKAPFPFNLLYNFISYIRNMIRGIVDPQKALQNILEGFAKLSTNPVLNCWSPLATPDKIPESEKFNFADGGCMDNLGVMSLLRRKVEKIVVFINGEIPLSTEVSDLKNVSSKDVDFWLTALFAVTKDDLGILPRYGADISHNKVFDSTEFKEVYTKLKKKKLAGEAVNTTTKHEVLKNDWWGIDGGYEVEICWVYAEDAKNWHDQLSNDLKEEFESGALDIKILTKKTKDFIEEHLLQDKGFPLYNTIISTSSGFSDLQANALAQFSSWVVCGDENKDEFINLLK